jgi:hypothetical protein
MVSAWFDAVTKSPTALLPLAAQTQPYTVSMEGYPAIVAGAYVTIGLTASNVTLDNFATSGRCGSACASSRR